MSESRIVTFWGGPMHGTERQIDWPVHRVSITGLQPGQHPHFDPGSPVSSMINMRRGVYTQVGMTLDFEWIGWEKR